MAQATNSLSPKPILVSAYPGVAKALAHRLARRAVERQLQAQGVRLTTFPNAQLVALARIYLAEHPELFDKAAEIVRTHPGYRAFVEREERERERQLRKAQRRMGVRLDRAVPQTGSAKSGMTQLFGTTSAILRGSCLLICELIEGTMQAGWCKVGDRAKSLCASPNHDKGET